MGDHREVAGQERLALCALFEEVGPAAPTLCAGWTTRDLAAHLAVRERRPDAAPGILLAPLAGYTARVQRAIGQRPWPDLVELVRCGPPAWSPLGLPGLADGVNATEFFVHHEDVRRARPAWAPRPPDPQRDRVLWQLVGSVGRLSYRNSPVGIVLRRHDGAEHTARRGPRTVTLAGAPAELVLHACGRDEVVVEFEGQQRDVAIVQGLRRGL